MTISEESIKALLEMVKMMKMTKRRCYTGREDQSIIREFMRLKGASESNKHKEIKRKISEELKRMGENVRVETTLNIAGIKIRPDVCYLEDGKWFIKEIECGFTHRNKILRNLDVLKVHADIEVINAGKPEKEYYWV